MTDHDRTRIWLYGALYELNQMNQIQLMEEIITPTQIGQFDQLKSAGWEPNPSVAKNYLESIFNTPEIDHIYDLVLAYYAGELDETL